MVKTMTEVFTISSLARHLNMDYRTLRKLIQPISNLLPLKKERRRILKPYEVDLVCETLGFDKIYEK